MSIRSQKRAEARTRYYTRSEAERIGWNVQHPDQGGSFLEEQEIVDHFPELKQSLGQNRPDFVATLNGRPSLVIECKADWNAVDVAVAEAREYADAINRNRPHKANFAIGVAGTPDKRVLVRCLYWNGADWTVLRSHGYALTQLPAPIEAERAIDNGNGTTDVVLPDEQEFFSAAFNINRILRDAKIEEAVRPKVIGSIILALYHGDFAMDEGTVIEHINANVKAAVRGFADVEANRRSFLTESLTLSTESHGLRSRIRDVVYQLERLNVRSIMRSGVDFLGQFYETFLRYGQDAKKLGIVFTPRHITRMCADIVDVQLGCSVYDPACGTGGFLVAAFDKMMQQATTKTARVQAKKSLAGFDTNPTVWALAILNMFFRGDGKSRIVFDNCFEHGAEDQLHDYSLLNPPFSQANEPETDFVDHAIAAVRPGGRIAAVLKTSVMVDPKLRTWRADLVAKHHVEAVISLPLELFYPTASPTVILVVRAHAPNDSMGTMVVRIENDGFEISKKRRLPVTGSQIDRAVELFHSYIRGHFSQTVPGFVTIVRRPSLVSGNEICAEHYLPSGEFGLDDYEAYKARIIRQIALAVVYYEEFSDELLRDFEGILQQGNRNGRPTCEAPLGDWFTIRNGRSRGLKNYEPGSTPYVSSGDNYNGIVGFIEGPVQELHESACATVSAFGHACIQPWGFYARGNGGSAVRVLEPKFALSLAELIWFLGQINAQRWRFHYGRMAIGSRLRLLGVTPPPAALPPMRPIRETLRALRSRLETMIEM